MNKIVIRDLDRFVEQTYGWTQILVLDVYRPVKFSFIIYPNFLKDLFVCEQPTFSYFRVAWFGLDIYRKEQHTPNKPIEKAWKDYHREF